MSSIQELCHSLCCHLTKNGEVLSTSKDFASLTTNIERVSYVTRLFERFELWPRVNANCLKSDEKSAKFREYGNRAFKAKKDGEALKMYTKSIAFAVAGTEALGLAFANRSAVLFERKLYKECLEDIQNALNNNYPLRLHEKIEKRRSKALTLSHKQKQEPYYLEIPKLSSSANPLIQCASDAVIIRETEAMGRHVIAAKDIAPGDVLALEKPYTKILLKERILDHCYHCLTLCYNLLSCPQCTDALFCSKYCLEEATYYHKYECPILYFLNIFNFSKLELIAVRVALVARNHYPVLDSSRKSEIYKSERYEEIHELITNTEKRSVMDLFKRTAVASVLRYIFENYTSFLQDGCCGEIFCDLLLRHLQTAPSNFHEISECVGSMDNDYESENIGAGAFSFLSLFNHSCSPNVIRHCHGYTIVLRALRPIKKGEQLFDNYGYHHALMCKEERQEHLKRQYLFQCVCEACEKDWPLYHDLKILDCSLELEDEDLKALKEGSLETARAIVGDFIKELEELDNSIPSKNLADAQEIVKQCFSIFGNKRTAF